jgi:arsenical pump membrane protein
LILAIFLLTLAIAIWQPRGLGIGFSALGGAIATLATGAIALQNLPAARVILGNNTLTLAALLALNWILEQTGALRWLALRAAGWNLNRGRLLFLMLGLATVVASILLTNCGATLTLTPFVFEILTLLGFRRKPTFAFAIATGFIADVASLAFTSSNLVNTIAASYADISPTRYASVMIPVSGVAIAASFSVFLFYFWSDIPPTYPSFDLVRTAFKPAIEPHFFPKKQEIKEPEAFPPTAEKINSNQPEKDTAKVDATIYFDPVSGFSYANSAVPLLPFTPLFRSLSPFVHFLNSTSVQIILFSWGMYIIAIALGNSGLITTIGLISAQFAQWGLFLSIISTGFLATILAAVTNNLPAVLIHTLAIQSTYTIPPDIQEGMVYAAVIGCTLGAKITPIGSLSTLLWLNILKRRGWDIKWSQYFRLNVILTLPVLFLTLLALAIWFPLLLA